MQENKPEMRKYMQNQEIDVNTCDASHMQSWIIGALKIKKIAKEEKVNNIRHFFSIRIKKE